MTDKNKIKDTDLQDVAGGRSDTNNPQAQPEVKGDGTPTSTPGGKSGRQLTPQEAASLSGGRSSGSGPQSQPDRTPNPGAPKSDGPNVGQ